MSFAPVLLAWLTLIGCGPTGAGIQDGKHNQPLANTWSDVSATTDLAAGLDDAEVKAPQNEVAPSSNKARTPILLPSSS
jgi:hypothetical protein